MAKGGSEAAAVRSRKAKPAARPTRATGAPANAELVDPAAPPGPVVVGVGASAGGLEAFTRLLQSLPPNPGAALVFVQHLSPDHESALPALLTRATRMPVAEARDGAILDVDRVYVIPPGMDIAIEDGHLRLLPRPPRRTPHMPLDLFLSTLAQAQGSRAIAVILSGTGSDGTLGCKAVKAAGGIAMAQDPETARYDGMPKSVIAEGCVDFVLPPEGLAREIVRLAREPYVRAPPNEIPAPAAGETSTLHRIFTALEKATAADFSSYKKTTVLRRIQRRMVLHETERLADYAKNLEANASEARALHDDLLIHVTSFFRDPSTFEALGKVLPRILHGRSAQTPVRVWIPGCATGEEAYSVAMCLLESLDDIPSNPPVQIFATDLSERAIEKARAGVFLANIAADISPERLHRFFVKVDGSYHVSKAVRDVIVFARQDMTRDPPFSRLDLISCRNVLIYLEPSLQRRVLSTFHYALAPGGFLILGRSETVGASDDLFDLVDKEHRIHTKVAVASPMPARPPMPSAAVAAGADTAERAESEETREAERLLLEHYAPASILVDENERVLQLRGDVERFLNHSRGAATRNLARMAPPEIVPDLRRLLQEVRARGGPRRKEGVVLHQRGRLRRVAVEVIPVRGAGSAAKRFLVLFEEDGPAEVAARAKSRPKAGTAGPRRIRELEEELAAFRTLLSNAEGEHAAHREELQSASEEVLSSNEELQSINEELQTAKEELQSGNEELTTVNDELRNRNFELQRLTDDLDNLVASVTIPMVILGRDLVVRRFTPAAAGTLGLQPSDVGRPLSSVMGITLGHLEKMVADVVAAGPPADQAPPLEREVQDREGRWWRLNIHPFRTRRNAVEGAVLVLVDVDALKRSQEILEDARDFADTIVDTVRRPLLVLTADLRVRRTNRAFDEMFGGATPAAEGATVYEIGGGMWDLPGVRTALEDTLGRGDSFEDHEVELEVPGAGPRILKLNGRRLRQSYGKEEMILIAVEDVTEATHLEGERAELMRRSEEAKTAAVAANKLKDDFVATASHELRGPLNAMVGWVHVLSGPAVDDVMRARALAAIDRSVKAQTRLVAELLDVTRIMAGKLQLSMRLVELIEVVESALQAARPTAETKGIQIRLAAEITPEMVLGDPDRLYQVVWNILSNAVKFTAKGGLIEVGLGREGTSTRLAITDTGQGITADFLPHVFERFRQGDGSPTRAQPGLGLGLAIVHQLVEMHGGTVTASSPGAGQGSTFVVLLPVPALRVEPPHAADGYGAPAAESTGPTGPSLAGLRVMVVDDDPDGRDILTTVLERAGARVTSAASATEALLAFAREVPDVLISDIGMPDRDGYDLIREIRRSPGTGGKVPALALTAFAAAADQEQATSAGFQAYLAKPAHPHELVATVALLAGRST